MALNTQKEADNRSQEQKGVVLSAMAMAFGTFSSRVLGLVRDMAFAALFSRGVTDAWTAAFRLPNLFRRLLGEGSLSVSFIPVFIEARLEDEATGGQRAQNLVNGFYAILLLILGVLTTLGIVFAEPILKTLLDEVYVSDSVRLAMTVRMAQIMFGFIFLMSQFAFFMGILNALGNFSVPAIAPVFFNIAMIFSTLIPQTWFTYEGDALAWGVLIGGLLQTGFLVPALKNRGYFPKVDLKARSADISRVFRNMLPGMIGTGLLQITTVVNLRFASSLGEGPISYIYWADRLLELPLSLVAVSLGTALLPTLSKMWSTQNRTQFLETSNYYLRLNLFVGIPAAIGLYVLAVPIVETLFQRGQFSANDVQLTAMVVSIYALTLIVASSVRVLVPAFYAIKNTWWPSLSSGLGLIAHILIAPYLMQHYGLKGLVYSSLISASLNFLLLAWGMSWFIGAYPWLKVLRSFLLFSLAGGAMGFAAWQVNHYLRLFLGDGEIARITSLGLSVAVALGIYGGISYLLKLEEFMVTFETIWGKIRRKLKR